MEVEGIGGPGAETAEEEEPVARAELSHKADGVLDWVGILPFCVRLASRANNDGTLPPDEEVLQGLLGRGQHALGDGVSGLRSRRRHGGCLSAFVGSLRHVQVYE